MSLPALRPAATVATASSTDPLPAHRARPWRRALSALTPLTPLAPLVLLAGLGLGGLGAGGTAQAAGQEAAVRTAKDAKDAQNVQNARRAKRGQDAGSARRATTTAPTATTQPAPATRSAKAAGPALPPPPAYGETPAVQALAQRLAAQHGLDAAWVTRTIASATPNASVQRLIMPAATPAAKNWAAYRARFVEPQRIAAGVDFWARHADVLARAEARYGVPAALIVGIIGVETYYGRVMGSFRVLDALATLSLDFPSGRSDRSAFFQDELGQFLAWTSREQLDPLSVRGSYAGALGLGQFMPGSLMRHAVDFDGDGHIDLRGSAADAIGSIAAYLRDHGWQPGLATHYAATPPADGTALATMLAPDIKPSFTRAQWQALGAGLGPEAAAHPDDGTPAALLALVQLHNGQIEGQAAAPATWLAGTQNFYAVTRYNWSAYYAAGVIDLGATVAHAWLARRGPSTDGAAASAPIPAPAAAAR
ncbi:MAG: hypothetical protein RLY78_3497 [Pseudomonadota bacterium]